jgi:membrane protease YdiL (CAAX protease family)
MILDKYNKTIWFYSLSLIIPWVFWFIAAYLSHFPHPGNAVAYWQGIFSVLGLIAPVIVAAYLFLSNRDILDDLKTRFFKLNGFPVIYLFIALLLIFLAMVVAQLLSLFLGHSLNQFVITGRPSFTSALFSPWLILVAAPIIEELAWHTYGTDTLRRRFNLFLTSVIFAAYWVVWHLPLSFVKGYYHSNVVAEGWIYGLNFVISLFVFVILMNWLYFKTNRNILIAIIFHLSANISNEIFATHPDSKVIQTALLLIICIFVVIKERQMFFSKSTEMNELLEEGLQT